MVWYLVGSLLCNTVFALCYKVAVRRKCNLTAVNSLLYVGAAAFMLLYALHDGRISYHPQALLLGLLGGSAIFAATLTFFYHMREGQLTVSWAVIGLTVGFPVVASMLFWHEWPTTRQMIGLLLIPVSLVLLSMGPRGAR